MITFIGALLKTGPPLCILERNKTHFAGTLKQSPMLFEAPPDGVKPWTLLCQVTLPQRGLAKTMVEGRAICVFLGLGSYGLGLESFIQGLEFTNSGVGTQRFLTESRSISNFTSVVFLPSIGTTCHY